MDCYACNGHGELFSSDDRNNQTTELGNSIHVSASETGYVACFRCEGRGSIDE